MIINDDFFALEDACDDLLLQIKQSTSLEAYNNYKQKLTTDQTAAQLRQDFAQKKQAFERIEAYGSHAPDYREKQRALRQVKRRLDLNETVADFRAAETKLQGVLDEICLSIANQVSENIKVAAGNPFFETGGHAAGCGGNCHAS